MRSLVMPLALVAASVLTAGVLVAGLLQREVSTGVSRATGAPAAREATVLSVLRHWDAQRSRAWARGDIAALEALYVPGSTAGERDVAKLHAWRERGLRVRGLRMQLLAVHVQVLREDRIVVRVLDRVARGWAGRADRWSSSERSERVETRLPTTVPAAHTITLLRRDGRWCVVRVRLSPGRWPAPR